MVAAGWASLSSDNSYYMRICTRSKKQITFTFSESIRNGTDVLIQKLLRFIVVWCDQKLVFLNMKFFNILWRKIQLIIPQSRYCTPVGVYTPFGTCTQPDKCIYFLAVYFTPLKFTNHFIILQMSDLQATLEFSVEFSKFYNVDLFQRGYVHHSYFTMLSCSNEGTYIVVSLQCWLIPTWVIMSRICTS